MRLSHLLLILYLEQQFFVLQIILKTQQFHFYYESSIHYLIGTLVTNG